MSLSFEEVLNESNMTGVLQDDDEDCRKAAEYNLHCQCAVDAIPLAQHCQHSLTRKTQRGQEREEICTGRARAWMKSAPHFAKSDCAQDEVVYSIATHTRKRTVWFPSM